MTLIEDLIGSVECTGAEVLEVVMGRRSTLVTTATGQTTACGLAARPPAGEKIEAPASDAYRGRPAETLLRLASSGEPLEASIRLATLNSLLTSRLDPRRFRPGTIPRAAGKRVVVAGDFPFTENLRSVAGSLHVLDWITRPGASLDDEAGRLIGAADIAIVGGAAILDGSLEVFLALARPCFTIVYGPSTPMSPILFAYGADQLVGVRIKDLEAAKRRIDDVPMEMMNRPGIDAVVLARDQAVP
jgi:uncharacterized protein (DUF4213/DUF364 family)